MTAFRLRTAEPEDEAAVTALTKSSYGALMPASYDRDLLDEVLPVISRANPRLLASKTYLLAVTDDGDVIGSGGWSREQPGTRTVVPGLGHVRHFATHPAWARRGVGRAIFARCASEAESAGIVRFECYASLNAVDFYTKLGFKAVRAMDVSLNDEHVMPVLLMEQAL